MTENYDLFPKDGWISRSEADHRDATDLLKAAVLTARSGSDEAIKQVGIYFCCFRSFDHPLVVFSFAI